jgi:hypothetical protein
MQVEPFLIVDVVAVIRRLIVVSAKAENLLGTPRFRDVLLESPSRRAQGWCSADRAASSPQTGGGGGAGLPGPRLLTSGPPCSARYLSCSGESLTSPGVRPWNRVARVVSACSTARRTGAIVVRSTAQPARPPTV